MGAWDLIGILVILALFPIGGYTRLAALRKKVQSAWSPLDGQLKRRHGLVSSLVETANGPLKHEREALESVTLARQQAIDAHGIPAQAEAENQLTETLIHLFVVAEADSDLKANHSMRALHEELATAQDQIAAAQFYNDQVMALNINIRQFPWNLIAGPGGFRPAEYFVMDEPAPREAPRVLFPASGARHQ